MGWLSKLLNPISIITDNKTVNRIVDPVGSAIGKGLETGSISEGLKDFGQNPINRVAMPDIALLARDPYKFLDYSAYGAGDFYSPTKTKKGAGWSELIKGMGSTTKGGNPIYDVAGPIAALITGGAFGAGAMGGGAGSSGNLASMAGPAGGGGASSLLGATDGASLAAMAGKAGIGGASSLLGATDGTTLASIAGPAGMGGASQLSGASIGAPASGGFLSSLRSGASGLGSGIKNVFMGVGGTPVSAGTTSGGLSGIGSLLSNPWVQFGGMSALDLLSKKRQTKNLEESADEYLTETTWNDETRGKFQGGLQGLIGEQINAAKRNAASAGAEAGRGGGSYGRSVELARQKGNEAAARLIAETYQPSNASFDAYMAKNQDPYALWLDSLLGVGGQVWGTQMGKRLAGGN